MSVKLNGWTSDLEETFRNPSYECLVPARVVCQHRHAFDVLTTEGEYRAKCTGRLLHLSLSSAELPVVGDWVALSPRAELPGEDGRRQADIHAILPRTGVLSRKAAGPGEAEQVLAANVDTLFLVMGLDANYNLRRLERYLALARSGGVEAVVVLNKADLLELPDRAVSEVRGIVPGVSVLAISALGGDGLAELGPWLKPGRTVAVLGSSGAGKSTLVNSLLGSLAMDVSAVSEADGKGRHTTTRRQLIVLESGAMVIDTPGMRELQFWGLDEQAVEQTFGDIAALAGKCRFHDCSHTVEPGCAILLALEEGVLAEDRWQAYSKLRKEQAYAARRVDPVLARQERDRWKRIHHGHRQRERFERDL